MNLSSEQCYSALKARDRRFDGLFFVGVRSTGIYCRPVCTSRTPGAHRCRYYTSAAGAEDAGFRPCLRCRPELAPGFAPVDASSRLAWSAIARLRAAATRDPSGRRALALVATELGCGERHLRRVVRAEIGVTPVQILQTSRLLAAKHLLTETALPVTTIAHAAGFASLRRFNALFRTRYRMSPAVLRRAQRSDDANAQRSALRPPTESVRLTLAYRPPFAWERALDFLRAHLVPGAEIVHSDSYARTVDVDGIHGWIRITNDAVQHLLRVELSESLTLAAATVLAKIRALFDLDARPDIIDAHLRGDRRLAPFIHQTPGLRVPGAFDGFELGWRTILGQQVSVRAATTVSGRVAAALGRPIDTPIDGLHRLVPTAERFVSATDAELRGMGLMPSRVRSLREFAAMIVRERVPLDAGTPPDRVAPLLLSCFGIGPWTVDYLTMRGLRWPDAFPATDLVLARAIGARREADVERITAPWRPWRSYAAMHLWSTSTQGRHDLNHETSDAATSRG